MKKINVVAIGEILFDVFEDGKRPGGSSLNVALHLYKQGIQIKFISAVGKDENGETLLTYLKEQNFDTGYIQVSDYDTSTVNVKLDEQKQATYTINQPVAWDDIKLSEDLKTVVSAADAFVYCSLTCRNLKSRTTIFELLENAKLKIFDINLRAPHFELETLKYLLSKADILKINEDELSYLAKELSLMAGDEQGMQALSKLFDIEVVCLTLGNKGAKVLHQAKIYENAGYPVKVKDTVGAGDSFLATFVSGYLQKLDMDLLLDNACKVGAFVASQDGANPKYPDNLLK
nr:carbohydrate kinase [uncultured Pedobacter sp.]